MATTPTPSPSLDNDGDSIITDMPSPTPPPFASTSTTPIGPLCTYGPRLAYTYFAHPAPRPDALNRSNPTITVPHNAAAMEHGEVEEGVHWFTIDDQLLYLSFFQDSGPLNAACLYRFCLHVHTLLEDVNLKDKRIILYSSNEADKKANSALLLALYAMIVMRWTPSDVLHPIACLELQPFRDAGYARADYHLSLQSTIYGISRAISLRLLDLSTFDLVKYEMYEKVEHGDWNWITPGFVAFASPVEPAYVQQGAAGRRLEGAKPRLSRSFRNVLDEFERAGVRVVIRLNKKLYDPVHFTERGMEHIEMYFDDGTNPPMEMTRQFIDISDRTISAGGSVAVHCKAGLGRTGTLIGAYLIYKHGFTASEAIGFMRLMRPGSCVGPQQHFLYENQMTWIRWAAIDAHKAELEAISRSVTPTPTAAAILTTPTNSGARLARPITPPNEKELAQGRSRNTTPAPTTIGAEPRTPGRVVPVPGQPRKTPGKTKHSVATPEVREEEKMEVLGDEMMLVEEDAGAPDEEDDESITPLPALTTSTATPATTSRAQNKPTPSTTAPTTRTTTSTRPTRIARARYRPLSALADNRHVDRLGLNNSNTTSATHSNATSDGEPIPEDFRRSKAVKDLGTLFEKSAQESRYDLRGGSGRSSPGAATAGTVVGSGVGLLPAQPPASPTKLPVRIPVKRKGGVKERTRTLTGGNAMERDGGGSAGGCAMESLAVVGMVSGNGGLNGPARSVRRRRSSLGSTDFVL